jgi:ribosomal protein L32
MKTSPDRQDAIPAVHLIPCRRCGRPVRPARSCPRCRIETPAPYADRPEVVVAIINGAEAARRQLRGAA